MATEKAAHGASFLYPFLETASELDSVGNDDGGVDDDTLAQLANAARDNWTVGEHLDQESLTTNAARLREAATLIATCTTAGRRVFTVGNGGSASDAERFVRLLKPTVRAQPLLDSVVITALANDVGADRIFDRQIETYVQPSDVVVAFSTSGTSPNILAALARARRQGAHTIVFAGYGGAALPANPNVDVCITVASSSVHRIQEAQGALSAALAENVFFELDRTTK